MTTLYLIRHADNDYLGKRLAGRLPGVHLNSRGQAQVQALTQTLAAVTFQAVYASPLERAMETAEPLARARGLTVVQREGLAEVRVGRWEGQSLKVLRRQKLWSLMEKSPSMARFPGGESIHEAQGRVVAELEDLLQMHPRRNARIACVSHADPIKLAIAHYIGLPLDMFQRLIVSPASVNVLRIEDGYAWLVRLNDSRARHGVQGG